MLHTLQRKIDLLEFYKFNVTNECSVGIFSSDRATK